LDQQRQDFLYLTTKGWKTGKQHTIEIWFVGYDGKYYVLSERRTHAHWIQNIIHDPRVLFTVNDKTLEGKAQIVDQDKESELAIQVSKLMSTKYGWDRGLIVKLIQG
jgi:deazaflavin-dependent oxidoreductase (nitroreductase family)